MCADSAVGVGEVTSVVSLCTGYGGLELALTAAGIDHELVAAADPDPAASKVLAHRHPAVPNLGDITAADWDQVGPVDIVAAGYPCQGFSLAGQRKGTQDERFIWPAVADAVRLLRPGCVLLENVAGHRSLGFGRVLADLAALGYVGSWVSVRASDVGAAHRRERVFIAAWPADTQGHLRRLINRDCAAATDTPGIGHGNPRTQGRQWFQTTAVAGGALLPTPRTSDANGVGSHGDGGIDLRTAVSLLPTPRATDGTKGGPNQRGSSGDLMLPSAVMLPPTPTATSYGTNQSPSPGAAVRPSLDGLMRLLPTPTAVHHARNATANRTAPKPTTCTTSWTLADVAHAERWGQYAPAIARWEHVLGRPAPEPTEPGKTGPRLAPRFVEWLMGLPEGWVCDVPGLSRNDMLRLLGNGVVYQQAAHAIQLLANLGSAVSR